MQFGISLIGRLSTRTGLVRRVTIAAEKVLAGYLSACAEDVINAIYAVLNNWSQGQSIYNVVNPAHPSKADYYAQKCELYGTQMPSFSSDEVAERKVIVNIFIIEADKLTTFVIVKHIRVNLV